VDTIQARAHDSFSLDAGAPAPPELIVEIVLGLRIDREVEYRSSEGAARTFNKIADEVRGPAGSGTSLAPNSRAGLWSQRRVNWRPRPREHHQ
jgi:hypothetical protein